MGGEQDGLPWLAAAAKTLRLPAPESSTTGQPEDATRATGNFPDRTVVIYPAVVDLQSRPPPGPVQTDDFQSPAPPIPARGSTMLRRLASAALLAIPSLLPAPAVVAGTAPVIRWEPRELRSYDGRRIAATLGRVTVPERHSVAHGRTIEIAFLKLPTTSKRPGNPIVFL